MNNISFNDTISSISKMNNYNKLNGMNYCKDEYGCNDEDEDEDNETYSEDLNYINDILNNPENIDDLEEYDNEIEYFKSYIDFLHTNNIPVMQNNKSHIINVDNVDNVDNDDNKINYQYLNSHIYKYNILSFLKQTQINLPILEYNIVPYHISCGQSIPFLQFLLEKTIGSNIMSFLSFIPSCCNNFLEESIFYISSILKNYCGNNLFYDFFIKNYSGYMVYNNKCYIFFDISSINIDTLLVEAPEKIWNVTVDEIIIQHNICNIPIDNEVVDFFTVNADARKLTNEFGYDYDFPSVVYTANTVEKTKFENVFGNVRKNIGDSLYYIFYSYDLAIKEITEYNEGLLINNRSNYNYGLVRYCLFYKKMYALDEKQTLNDIKGEMFLKYDVLYKSVNMDSYMYIVNNYKQQIPISRHLLNLRTKHIC